MKSLMKALGMALLFSGVVAVTNAQTTPAQTPAKSATTTNTATPPAKTMDKVVGTDAKGHKIYQGPKGGQYYINDKGGKAYLPKGTKVTPMPNSK
jgi:colicin import membrane protein